MTSALPRRCAAELVGTALLIVFGPGSVVAAMTVDKAVGYAALGVIGLSFGLVVAVVIYAFGTTSGAHINPAVTISLAVTKRFPWRDVGPYVAAQLVGSVLGGVVVVGAFGRVAVDRGNVGGVAFGVGVHYPQAILVEAVATYLLVLAIMGTAVDRRAPSGWAGLVIGLSVTSLVVVFGPLTGAAVNPARALGPNAAASAFGGSVAWSQYPAYVVGSLLGALAAACSYDLIARPRAADAAAQEQAQADGTQSVEGPQGTQGDVTGSRT